MDGIKQVGTKVSGGAAQWCGDFKTFINKGNVIDLAVAFIIGAAFSAIVKSIVADLITPIIGLAGGKQLENIFVYLEQPPICVKSDALFSQEACDLASSTLETAQEAGGVTWNIGRFLQTVIDFLLVALILFFIIKAYTAGSSKFQKEKAVEEATMRECPFCLSECKIKAIKCAACASTLPELPKEEMDIAVKIE